MSWMTRSPLKASLWGNLSRIPKQSRDLTRSGEVTPLGELVREGLAAKLTRMPAQAQPKMREALGKIINEGSGGMICILL